MKQLTPAQKQWLCDRLSILAKQQGGENSDARKLRNRLNTTGLTESEYEYALEMLDSQSL